MELMDTVKDAWILYLFIVVGLVVGLGIPWAYGKGYIVSRKFVEKLISDSKKTCRDHINTEIKISKLETGNQINILESTLKSLVDVVNKIDKKLDRYIERIERGD